MFALLLACAQEATPPVLSVDAFGVRVEGEVQHVQVLDPDGVPMVSQRAPVPVPEMRVLVPFAQGGEHTVVADGHELSFVLPDELPRSFVEIEAPVGQGRVPVVGGKTITVSSFGETPHVGVLVRSFEARTVTIQAGGVAAYLPSRAGERVMHVVPVTEPVEVTVDDVTVTLVPQERSLEEARQELTVREVVFPAEPGGWSDLARAQDRVTLPSAWWARVLDGLGLGYRARDAFAPWAWQGVVLENAGNQPVDLVVTQRILHEDAPDPAFAPRMRAGDDGTGQVRALIRVPANGEARASLPVFVNEDLLGLTEARERQWTAELTLTPLGSAEPLRVDRRPLYASRGSTIASVGLIAAILAAFLGTGLLVVRGRRWLTERATSELMTIALFGAMTFLVGVAGRLLGSGVSALLGPFSSFLTGVVDDALRYALFATLLVLIPRKGVGALAVLVGWLLNGLALGSFSITDMLFVGGRIFWLESFLWLAGITRATGWLDESGFRRWLRLSVAFGLSSALTNATGLVLHVTLYRLFLADWYVAGIIGGPGFLYIVGACALAVPFSDSLRRIQR
ncbi:MAG: hypothetical protein GY913_05470 [Proteobacteria bacterium]|nr:hypothetical protein [Pseudomonadota bacterium]MCP4916352.1 hypothetical protein [Pseudomonadota bacterium]